jgi:hypothetical protein
VLKSFRSSGIEKSLGFKNNLNELTENTKNLEGKQKTRRKPKKLKKIASPSLIGRPKHVPHYAM